MTRQRSFCRRFVPCSPALFQPADTAEFCSAALELERKRPGNIGSKKSGTRTISGAFKKARKDINEILVRKTSLFRTTVDPSDPVITGSAQFLRDLSSVFSRVRGSCREREGVSGGLDFSDLILHARGLFTEQRELVATHFMPRFRYILVDEFQDTDLTQFDIILAIIGTPSPENGLPLHCRGPQTVDLSLPRRRCNAVQGSAGDYLRCLQGPRY